MPIVDLHLCWSRSHFNGSTPKFGQLKLDSINEPVSPSILGYSVKGQMVFSFDRPGSTGTMPQIVLVQPQIPPNTGNIARTCAATCTPLHLVGPLGFEISDRYLKRAGLDYWPYVDLHYHESLSDFQHHHQKKSGRWVGFSTTGKYSYIKFEYREDDWLLFGCETAGLPADVLQACDATVYIPMHQAQVRSLNLSVSVAIGLFEVRRQLGYMNEFESR